jgi:hypothetical protein
VNSTFMVIRAVRGPLLLITLGVLMALHRFQNVSFTKTWPVLLILLGVLKLLEMMALRSGEPASPAGGMGSGPYA